MPIIRRTNFHVNSPTYANADLEADLRPVF
jgi:hypothetical protein